MKERQINLNKIPTSFTYWDNINVFSKVLYYNNKRHKHTWFVKSGSFKCISTRLRCIFLHIITSFTSHRGVRFLVVSDSNEKILSDFV
ncbi:hypothetical protein H5410_002674 [Solanum commersonii]|uniref:Uncharacterized protein n=1 Tax=Solanum commersonii TaxID=4109 RepID=A0A9J6B2H7_SOLCO|nr:hypothetical protein H5410_002674 [Solanum commersonii]